MICQDNKKRVIRLLLFNICYVVVFILHSRVYAQDNIDANAYIHNVIISADSKDAVFRSLVDTFNTYGYFVDTLDGQAGTLSASIIDYSSFYRGKKFTGINELAKMQQIMDVKVTDLTLDQYKLSLKITYKKEIVTVLDPYQTFVSQLEQSSFLK